MATSLRATARSGLTGSSCTPLCLHLQAPVAVAMTCGLQAVQGIKNLFQPRIKVSTAQIETIDDILASLEARSPHVVVLRYRQFTEDGEVARMVAEAAKAITMHAVRMHQLTELEKLAIRVLRESAETAFT